MRRVGPYRQFPRRMQALVEIEHRLGQAVSFIDRREARAIERLHPRADRGFALGLGLSWKLRKGRKPDRPGIERDQPRVVGVDEDAGRLAIGVTNHVEAAWRGIILRQLACLQRRGVGDADAGDRQEMRLDIDGVVGGHLVEVVTVRPPLFPEGRREAIVVGHLGNCGHDEPCARRQLVDMLLDVAQHVVDAFELAPLRPDDVPAGAVHMRMRVDEAGRNGAAVQVDLARCGSCEIEHLAVAPDRDDAAVLDGDGFGHGVAGIRGVHRCVVQHRIRRRFIRGRRANQAGAERCARKQDISSSQGER